MKKIKNSVYVIIIILVISFVFIFTFASKKIINKLSGNISYIKNESYLKYNPNNYPVIVDVFNSSGGKTVNTDVVITVNIQSLYKIKNIEYSFDLSEWYSLHDSFNNKKVTAKILFSKTMNSKVYIRCENAIGLKSYPYETYVNIDKKKPKISFKNNGIIVSDNQMVQKLQYFNDLSEFKEEEILSSKVVIKNDVKDYKYLRAVDEAGNISDILLIN